MNRFRIVFLSACLVLAGIAGALLLIRPHAPEVSAQGSGGPSIGGAFQLTDQDGRAVDQRLLNGKWTAVFFGYTFCPDACPTTLHELAAVQDKLGPRAKDFQIVFVSIDPARDTPAKLKDYLLTRGFPKGVIGLTGTAQQVAAAAKAYRVSYEKQGKGADYSMDHTVVTYLMNPQGRFVAPLLPGETPQAQSARVLNAMQHAQ